MLVIVIGCDEETASRTQDISPACRTITLEATRAHQVSLDGDLVFADAIALAVPASLEVTTGNAGNKKAELVLESTTTTTRCQYRGTANGSSYALESCNTDKKQPVLAGAAVDTIHLHLSIDSANVTTTARATLEEATPCAPVIVIETPLPGQTVGPTGEATFDSLISAMLAFTCELDGTAVACTSPFAWTGLAAGTHTLRVRGTDLTTGRVGAWSATTFEVDAEAPAITILGFDQPSVGTDPVVTGSSGTLHFSTLDPYSLVCRIDGFIEPCQCNGTDCTLPFSDLADALHTADITAGDEVGNARTVQLTWAVDRTGPGVVFSEIGPFNCRSDDGVEVVGDSPQVAWSVIDQGTVASGFGGATCTLGIGDPFSVVMNTDCGTSIGFTGLVNGHYRLLVAARDAVNNSATFAREFVVDSRAPLIHIVSPNDGEVIDVVTQPFGSFMVDTDSSTQPPTISCTIDNVVTDCSTGSFALGQLANGPHTIAITGRDCVGNSASVTSSFVSCSVVADDDGCCPPGATTDTDNDCPAISP